MNYFPEINVVMTQRKNNHSLLIFLLLFIPDINATEISALQDSDILSPDKLIYLEQNWTEKDRQWFYHADQGSRLIPYDMFINLEQPNNTELFRTPGNMLKYGFLPSSKSKLNPDNLPIGFARNGDHLGLTCAACHTQQLKYQDKFIRIDGGQSMIDLPMLLLDLEKALENTLQYEDKLARYVTRMKGKHVSANARDRIKQLLTQHYDILGDYNYRNHTDVAYGYARLDAFGAILNKGLFLTGVKDNFNPPNAPTSYPYLWDTPQHNYVEWNGSQSNSNVGALARNVGEVIGVFGDVTPLPQKWLFFFDGGYRSSIQTRNLRKFEKTISKLYSPHWPELFPPVNLEKARAGRKLFTQYCIYCHEDINRTDPNRKILVKMSSLAEIDTDPLMAKNALEHKGKTGIFKGLPRFYKKGDVMGEEAPALFIVNNIMVGILKNNILQTLLAKRDAKKLGLDEEIHPPKILDGQILEHGTETSEKALLAYKGRPLNGIWAGGPYLHNGSVPNLYQLLLPAGKRDKIFYIGSWEFDPVNVGYTSTKTPGAFLFDTNLRGNNNTGHEYGTKQDGLTEEDIWALIEYMKTL